MAFATVEDFATVLRPGGGEIDAPDAATASYLLDIATEMIQRATGQTISQAVDDVATLSPRGHDIIVLPQVPVTAVALVTVEGVAQTVTTDYTWESCGFLFRADGRTWGSKRRSVVVTYTHGYATIPDDIQGVTVDIAKRAFENPAGLQREDLNTASQWLGLTAENRRVLDKYRRVLVG